LLRLTAEAGRLRAWISVQFEVNAASPRHKQNCTECPEAQGS
jgi:hypothetical protein